MLSKNTICLWYDGTALEAARDAGATLARAGSNDSRLFAIDAGLDRDALRAKYPDRTTYAIVRGQVRAIPRTSDAEPAGAISALSAGEINVPQRLRGVLA